MRISLAWDEVWRYRRIWCLGVGVLACKICMMDDNVLMRGMYLFMTISSVRELRSASSGISSMTGTRPANLSPPR